AGHRPQAACDRVPAAAQERRSPRVTTPSLRPLPPHAARRRAGLHLRRGERRAAGVRALPAPAPGAAGALAARAPGRGRPRGPHPRRPPDV
ncbi:MAG: hypothetical protein AVDCRST_MAG30-4302, partial [uncultured Solirubrobacteraceae bacterium]